MIKRDNWALRSPLFRWILGAITVPLLLTMLGILVYLVLQITNDLPALIDEVEKSYLDIERNLLQPTARLRANYFEEIVSMAVRDAHFAVRFFAWMYFGALRLSDTIPLANTATEFCKTYPINECPIVPDLLPRPCEWEDPLNNTCDPTITRADVRPDQNILYAGLKEDAYPNGDRNFTSYPAIGFFPNETEFWNNMTEMPGAQAGANATGHETTFARVRTLAAAAVVAVPLFNYPLSGSGNRLHRSHTTGIGFDADGMFGGYFGSDQNIPSYAHFQSTEENGAYLINETLCPLGKYGYDARCRGWYAVGKEIEARKEAPLFMVPPFQIAVQDIWLFASVLPINNDRTGEYIGQAIFDFFPTAIFTALTQEETELALEGFHTLTTVEPDESGTNTIVGPNFDYGKGDRSALKDVLIPYNRCPNDGDTTTTTTTTTGTKSKDCQNSDEVDGILRDMEQGGSAYRTFTRRSCQDCPPDQIVNYAYAPVNVTSFRFVDPSDMSAGVIEYNPTVYVVGLGETEDGLIALFRQDRNNLSSTVRIALGVLLAIIVVAFAMIVYVAYTVSASITHPIGKLLVLVIGVNRDDIDADDGLPEIEGGSVEVRRVRETFDKLFMMIRFATTAFYSGDLDSAYKSFLEARDVFTKVGNEKAIGIANNSLGNIMLACYRTMKETKVPKVCGMSKLQVIEKGLVYYKAAIDTGEVAIERINQEEGFSEDYLIFMQQLSNRYFNRAMFLLAVRRDHPDPEEAEQQGSMDLATCKDMDREVIDNGDREGFKGDPDDYFELLMSRIKGVLHLLHMGYEDEWGIEELFVDARKTLSKSLGDPKGRRHGLFRNVEPAGQMQRLDMSLMEYYCMEPYADSKEASRIAIRMLIEDDYVMGEAAVLAIQTLLDGLDDDDDDDDSESEEEVRHDKQDDTEKDNGAGKAKDTDESNDNDNNDDNQEEAANQGTEDKISRQERNDSIRMDLLQYKEQILQVMAMQFSGSTDVLRPASHRASNLGDFAMEMY